MKAKEILKLIDGFDYVTILSPTGETLWTNTHFDRVPSKENPYEDFEVVRIEYNNVLHDYSGIYIFVDVPFGKRTVYKVMLPEERGWDSGECIYMSFSKSRAIYNGVKLLERGITGGRKEDIKESIKTFLKDPYDRFHEIRIEEEEIEEDTDWESEKPQEVQDLNTYYDWLIE